MSEENEAVVAAIVADLVDGATLPWEKAAFLFHRAIGALRSAAGNSKSVISSEQRARLDAAITTAQPHIAIGAQALDLRMMVGSLHAVTAEWANPSRAPAKTASPTVLEAFMLAKILDNWLDSATLLNLISQQRSVMGDDERHSLRDTVDRLYPLDTSITILTPPETGSIN